MKTSAMSQWCPFEPHPKQKIFLTNTATELLFGGAANGGKSVCLLMAALEYVDRPNYRALILRRSYRDLALPGALMDMSKQWLMGTAAKWNGSDKCWTFPSGAVIQFGYLESEQDKYRYQGSQYHFVAFDELTQFNESQYLYLLSRVRKNNNDPIPLRIRSASNPGNSGHKWVFKRFVDGHDPERGFIPACVDDNPTADVAAYEKMLRQLDEVTYQQLRHGAWILDESGIIYPYSDELNGIDSVPTLPDTKYVLGIDFGASTTKKTTAFSLTAFSYRVPNLVVCLESSSYAGMIPSTIAEKIKEYQADYDLFKIVGDAGALGIGYIEEFRQRHAIPIMPAKKANKLGYIRLMRGDIEKGHFKVVRKSSKMLIDEFKTLMWKDERQLEAMSSDGKRDPENHNSDSCLYSWRECRYWQAQQPEIIPPMGTPEHAEREARIMKEAAVKQALQDESRERRLQGRRR